MTHFEVSIGVFWALVVILVTCRVTGWLVRPLGQPQVVAEMIAGVLLGPSALGAVWPELSLRLFPEPVLLVLYNLAQIGLAIYMFLVGSELDLSLLRQRAASAVAVSWTGILVPFGLGSLLAWKLKDRYPLFSAEVELWEACLFLGAAMSITAFPMLARILYERQLTATSLGTLALAAGALDDAAAWCLLAAVIAGFSNDPGIALLAVGGGALYAVTALTMGRRFLNRLFRWLSNENGEGQHVLSVALILIAAAAYLTDSIGIYAVFGTFVLGAAMPRDRVRLRLEASLNPFTTSLLLPMFFVYSGLNTRIQLLGSLEMFGVTLLILGASVLGKGVACGLAAWATGASRSDAWAIGALMNARGLMELILLNIGLQHGVITPTLFTILVVMAVVTTVAAGPAFELIRFGHLLIPPRSTPASFW